MLGNSQEAPFAGVPGPSVRHSGRMAFRGFAAEPLAMGADMGRISRGIRRSQARIMMAALEDDGMSTAEYAIGTIAAAAFGAILYTVVTGDNIVNALTGIIDRALSTSV